MVHSRVFLARSQWPALQFFSCAVFNGVGRGSVIAGLLAVALPLVAQRPAEANEFANCASALVDSGIEPSLAAAACGSALRPEQVSACVERVVEVTDVGAVEALSACSRDRRPQEVGTCVADIHNALTVGNSAEVLERCQLSVLPERYSACVVGLADGAGLAIDESLNQCINAGYRPADVAPTFVPAL